MSKLPGSFAAMGDPQWLPGYSVLLVDQLGVDRLSDLPRPARLVGGGLQIIVGPDLSVGAFDSVAERPLAPS